MPLDCTKPRRRTGYMESPGCPVPPTDRLTCLRGLKCAKSRFQPRQCNIAVGQPQHEVRRFRHVSSFCTKSSQVGLVNNVEKGKRKATMASGRLSMVGPFSESGVRPAYPIFILFLTFVESPTWNIFAQSRLGKGIHHKAVARILAFRPPTKKRRHSSLGAGKPGDGISRYFDWFRQSREYRNRLFRHSRAA